MTKSFTAVTRTRDFPETSSIPFGSRFTFVTLPSSCHLLCATEDMFATKVSALSVTRKIFAFMSCSEATLGERQVNVNNLARSVRVLDRTMRRVIQTRRGFRRHSPARTCDRPLEHGCPHD